MFRNFKYTFMKIIHDKPFCQGYLTRALLAVALLFTVFISSCSQGGVKLEVLESQHEVNIYMDGKLFTTYMYSPDLEKPILYPVNAPNGSVITRGFPFEPRKGERLDHPHQVGIWFNHGNVNGLDFWNNSKAIREELKDSYGHIAVNKITKATGGNKGILEVMSEWKDNHGNTLLNDKTTFIFSGDNSSWTIDHISTLTATNGPVVFTDNKEGMFAIRVDRAFEMPAEEALVFTDDKGNPTTVKATDHTGVTGMYTSSNGKTGDDVWGTRNEWVYLSGVKDNTRIAFGIFDHPSNPGFPAYAHARGYGLFSVNNLGQNAYDPAMDKKEWALSKGESMTLRHRFHVQAGEDLSPAKADEIFKEFSKLY